MRRFNRLFLFSFTCLMLVTMSGCGLIPLPEGFLGQEEDLSATEILVNAQSRLSSLSGYHINAKGIVARTMQGTVQQQQNLSFELDQKYTNQPLAMHSVQKEVNEQGVTKNQELYIVDGSAYNYNGFSWRKVNYNEDMTFSNNPKDILRFAAEAQGEGVDLTKEQGAFVIKLNQNAGRAFLQQLFRETKEGFRTQGIYIGENDFQVSRFQQTIWIDEETFMFKKMDTDLAYNLQYDGRSIAQETRLQVDYQGDYNSQIQVPAHVKTSVGY